VLKHQALPKGGAFLLADAGGNVGGWHIVPNCRSIVYSDRVYTAYMLNGSWSADMLLRYVPRQIIEDCR
jgi:hypothetical protein